MTMIPNLSLSRVKVPGDLDGSATHKVLTIGGAWKEEEGGSAPGSALSRVGSRSAHIHSKKKVTATA